MTPNTIIQGDCLKILRTWPDRCVDLIVTSPPYEDARTYGIDFSAKGEEWVEWMIRRVREFTRVCKGLVVIVCEGKTRNFRYSATPLLLAADLHRSGYNLRKPPIFHRVGIPGSGGPDWLRNDYEFCICITPPGRLPWSDNTAMGHTPKYADGGGFTHRAADGSRVSRPRRQGEAAYQRSRDAYGFTPHSGEPSPAQRSNGAKRRLERGNEDGSPARKYSIRFREDGGGNAKEGHARDICAIANPGNVIKCNVGGGLMGSKLAHENEAPFPEKLAEFFVRSFCPPSGIVLDPFCGSGTTCAVAQHHGRQWVGIDVRQSQVDLTLRRLTECQSTTG